VILVECLLAVVFVAAERFHTFRVKRKPTDAYRRASLLRKTATEFGLFLALAKLLGWNSRKRFLNMLAASGPGYFSTAVAGC
jgi:hypothetical protein